MKKRYIIIPLIMMGLILLLSLFIIRVNAEEIDERSIGNNADSRYTTSNLNSNYCHQFYISMSQSFIDYVGSKTGSNNNDMFYWSYTSTYAFKISIDTTNHALVIHDYVNNIDVALNLTLSLRIFIQINYGRRELWCSVYNGRQQLYTFDVEVDNPNYSSLGFYLLWPCSYISYNSSNSSLAVFDWNDFPSDIPITNIITYPEITNNANNYYYFKELTRVWDDTYNNNEYVNLVNFIDTADNEYKIRLYRPLPNDRSVITRDTYLQLYDETNNIMYYNKLYDKEESFNIYYDDYNGYIHFYHMRQNILNGNIQFVEYDHIYNFTGTRKLTSISCDLESVSSASFTDYRVLSGSDINEEILQYSLNRIVNNWDTVFNNGYNAGYAAGQAGENSISPFVNIITNVFTGIDSILQIEMIPHIKLWYFIAIPLTFVILWGVFKIFKSH